ncbi:MAG: GNAT family N-acyltransferase [Bacteroidota bacterium]
MGLINIDEISKAIKLDKFGFVGRGIAYSLFKLLKLDKIDEVYIKNIQYKDVEFLDNLLNDFGIKFEIHEDDLKRIPNDGAFITISNHPLGALDGILLLKLLLEKRSDFKVMGNFLLQKIEPMKDMVVPVNPFEEHKDSKSSVNGIKESIMHIKSGHPLGIFPAGEVSTFKKEEKSISDKEWEEGAVKLIQKLKVPVVPIYFHAKNSKLFYFLSALSGTLRTAKLPSEVLSQKTRLIKVRIGKAITVKEQAEHSNIDSFSNFLRQKTYILANTFKIPKKEKYIPKFSFPKTPKKIIIPVPQNDIINEVDNLRKDDKRIIESKNYEVFLTDARNIPNIITEIGRLREITFREVGEGTNNEIDLDKYDEYYHHLFLWDSENQVIAGAYRMGMGIDIYNKYGIDGFYINELFRFEPELYKMMSQSIEMGRAFIIKEYQQKPMPLFLLWKAIVNMTIRYPEYKYLIGGVSISNQFSNFSKSLMIEFMKSHYYDPFIAQFIRPKKEYKVKLKDADKDFVFDASKADLNKFDKIIDDIEPGSLRLPVLMKKYVKQNAKIIAFNVDPKFNDAIDGLMYIEIANLPESTVRPVLEEFQAELEKKASEKEDVI